MLKRMNHIGIAVKDIEAAIKSYYALGAKLEGIYEIPTAAMKVAIIKVGDGAKIEFLQPLNADSNIAKFIENRGEGIEHMAFEVDDIDKELASLSAKGVQLIDKVARRGVTVEKMAFLSPQSVGGIPVELVEPKKSDGH